MIPTKIVTRQQMRLQKIFAIVALIVGLLTFINILVVNNGNTTAGKYKPGYGCCQEDRKECYECQYEHMIVEACADDPDRCPIIKKCCKKTPKQCSACVYASSLFEQCRLNSSRHGCSEEIMLGIPIFNKGGYTKFTAQIWQQYHKFPQKHIHLFDAWSTEYNESLLRKWYGNDIQYFRSSQNISTGMNIRRLLEYFSTSNYKILILLSSDSVLQSGWQDFIKKYIYSSTDGFLSLYHSAELHDMFIDCPNVVGDLCQADFVSQYGVALTRPLAKSLVTNHNGPFDDLNWRKILRSYSIRFFYPKTSLSMQIGQIDQGSDNCGKNDVAYRFNRCKYPEWIRNGINFFFDRCTNSSEIYSPLHYLQDLEKSKHWWTRPVISYSLYGDHPSYSKIALENARRVFLIYPGWKIWIYHDNSVPTSVLDELCEFDIHFVNMTSQNKYKNKRSWRFLVGSELVKFYAIRDIDSYLLPRGKAAVDEWIASGKMFHVMRDSQYHKNTPIMGGMWGARHEAVPNMAELMENKNLRDTFYGDQSFLSSVIWPMARKSSWQHDSHSSNNFGESHPFPTNQQGRNLWVGNIVIPHKRG